MYVVIVLRVSGFCCDDDDDDDDDDGVVLVRLRYGAKFQCALRAYEFRFFNPPWSLPWQLLLDPIAQ